MPPVASSAPGARPGRREGGPVMATVATDKAAPDGRGKRSRREVLAGAAGALGVLAAQVVGRATPAQAGSDGDVVLGVNSQSTSGITGVTTTAGVGLSGTSKDSSGFGVYGGGGNSGVWAEGGNNGVYGNGGTNGVYGYGPIGVYGDGGTYGVKGNGDTGVFGLGYNGNGVFGQTSVNIASGVYGQNDGTGYGVAGRAAGGIGTLGDSANGIGVWRWRVAGGIAAPGSHRSRRDSLPSPGSSHQPIRTHEPIANGRTGRVLLGFGMFPRFLPGPEPRLTEPNIPGEPAPWLPRHPRKQRVHGY